MIPFCVRCVYDICIDLIGEASSSDDQAKDDEHCTDEPKSHFDSAEMESLASYNEVGQFL